MKSKLAITITLSGWLLFVVWLFYDYAGYKGQVIRHIFYPPSTHELLFHIVVFIAPLVSIIMGVLVNERTKLFNTAKKSEKKYRDLYENAPDGYHSIGPDGAILEVNNTWLKMLGYEKDEVIGKLKLTDFLTEDGLKTFQDTFPEFMKKGLIENLQYDLKGKDGTLLPVLINATAIYDEKGNFLKSRSIVRDISARISYRKKLEHSIKDWKATFDSMPYGVILLDREFTVIKTNEYISRLTGIPVKELFNMKCYELIHGKDKPIEGCPLLKSIKSAAQRPTSIMRQDLINTSWGT